jgi:1,4-alpha-glucan branching enzyme
MGIPMLWMGEEFGETSRETPNQQNKLHWSLLNQELNRSLFEYYKKLIVLRKSNQALHTDNIEFFHENNESKVIAYTRWNDQGDRVVVVANFSDQCIAGYKVSNFPAAGTWREWTSNIDIEVGDELIIDLPEYQAKVFVWN